MKILTISIFIFSSLSCASVLGQYVPNCSGTDNWATNMAFTHLKNAGLINNETLDFSKTKTSLLASERIGEDLYRQIHLIKFIEKTGREIDVITVNNASSEECSMSGVVVYLLDRKLGSL
jgi:hypothetical protein